MTIRTYRLMRCTACQKSKPASAFYRNSRMASGYLNQCKGCVKDRVHAHRRENVDRFRARDAVRNKRPDRVQAKATYKTTKAGKASHNKSTKNWAISNAAKRKAHIIVSNALRAGTLVKKLCYKCSAVKVQAHHKDYSKPLDVIWCCAKHHKEFHR